MPDTKIAIFQPPADFVAPVLEGVNLLTPVGVRSARKVLKRTPDLAVLVLGLDMDSQAVAADLIQLLRDGLNNHNTRVLVLAAQDCQGFAEQYLVRFGADVFLAAEAVTADRLEPVLRAEMRTFAAFQAREERRETEVAILTTLGRLARADAGEVESQEEMLSILGAATGASRSAIVAPDSDAAGEYQLVRSALQQRTLQLCVDADYPDHRSADVVGSIAIPLLCYDQVIAVLHFQLGQPALARLTVEFIELLGKVATQLRILYERRAAEAELETQYQRVKQTLATLESTQMQLYQSEKLASVGQLAAGIAHEINNPIAFLAGNIGPLEEYTDAMATMLSLHQDFIEQLDATDALPGDERRGALREKADELDIAFVMEDVRSLVEDSRNGLHRVSDIVQNLTRFARKDSMDLTEASLESGLDDTLKLLSKQIPIDIEVQRDYAGIPPVVCNHGMVNQVFLNLLKNASQALGETGRIVVSSEELTLVDDQPGVRISVRDDGPGIPEDIRSRLFEPFFTTKAPGQGTGLGLSMCYDIIDRHGGALHFESAVGEGTVFMVDLPLRCADTARAD